VAEAGDIECGTSARHGDDGCDICDNIMQTGVGKETQRLAEKDEVSQTNLKRCPIKEERT